MIKRKSSLSVVIPVYNEENNVGPLHKKLVRVLGGLGCDFEIIFVNDGSEDGTEKELKNLRPVKIVNLRRNFGQSAALDAGINFSSGEIIVTMDGDLQNDPKDIPALVDKIKEGWDVVSGWRYKREDSFWVRSVSKIGNLIHRLLFGKIVHDCGCMLKAYRRECFEEISLYGEIHRFIPALLSRQGFTITEVKVSHHPRKRGKTKYGWRKTVKSLVDLLNVWFWWRFSDRPLYLFGISGFLLSLSGAFLLFCLLVLRLFHLVSLSDRIWPLLSILMILTGAQFFSLGILADIMLKSYYQAGQTEPYQIGNIVEKE